MDTFLVQDRDLANQLERQIKGLADKLRDPEHVESTVINKVSTYDIKEIAYYYGWSGTDLGNGFPGICCFLAELDKTFPNKGWDVVGHTYLVRMKEYMESDGFHSLSLWGGLTGICFATLALSRNGIRYQNLLNQLHDILIQNLPAEIDRCMRQIPEGVEMPNYDVIGGLTGIGRYLLYHKDKPDMKRLLDGILRYLIALTEDKVVIGEKVPGWYIPSKHQFLESEKVQYPNGNFNLGFAHGIPGCLALLSIAKIQGYEIENQNKAISVIANWLVAWSQEDQFGPLWPRRVSLEEQVLKKTESKATVYEAWCYGEIGIARSIWLAGTALQNEGWKELALDVFKGLHKRSNNNFTLISPTYCHGIAGSLHTVQLMLQEHPTESLLMYRNFLLEKLVDHIDMNKPFGVTDNEVIQEKCYAFDKPGLLNGSAGIAMVLLSVIRERGLEWDSVFLVR